MRLWIHVCKCLIVFLCMLINNKVWKTNLGQSGSKSGFLGKSWMGSERKPKNLDCLTGAARLARWHLPWRVAQCNTHVFGCPGQLGFIPDFPNASFDVFDCCFHFLTYWNINWIGLKWFLWIELKLIWKCSRTKNFPKLVFLK